MHEPLCANANNWLAVMIITETSKPDYRDSHNITGSKTHIAKNVAEGSISSALHDDESTMNLRKGGLLKLMMTNGTQAYEDKKDVASIVEVFFVDDNEQLKIELPAKFAFRLEFFYNKRSAMGYCFEAVYSKDNFVRVENSDEYKMEYLEGDISIWLFADRDPKTGTYTIRNVQYASTVATVANRCYD
jgi:hypothetical protein